MFREIYDAKAEVRNTDYVVFLPPSSLNQYKFENIHQLISNWRKKEQKRKQEYVCYMTLTS